MLTPMDAADETTECNLMKAERSDSCRMFDCILAASFPDLDANGMKLTKMFSQPMRTLMRSIFCPQRSRYSILELGASMFFLKAAPFERYDFCFRNSRGQLLQCSHFGPATFGGPKIKRLPCLVYMHGCGACRLEAIQVVRMLLPMGVSVLCFDSSGSGMSEGDFTSLGLHEEKDLEDVINLIYKSGMTTSIAVWGRSMGAASAAFRAMQDPSLAAVVLDSSYSNLRTVAKETAKRMYLSLPDQLLDTVLDKLREETLASAGFDINDLAPVKSAPCAQVPALIGVARQDELIPRHHGKALFEAWGASDKTFLEFDGTHNGDRPQWFSQKAANFIVTRLHQAAVDMQNGPRTFAAL